MWGGRGDRVIRVGAVHTHVARASAPMHTYINSTYTHTYTQDTWHLLLHTARHIEDENDVFGAVRRRQVPPV